MKYKFFAVTALFSLLGAETPDWFSNPTLDTNFVYGFGIGSNVKLAKENAIIDLASSLSSSVNAVLQREIKRNDTNITSLASQKFSINTKGVEFANIETKKLECIQDQCYAWIEISKVKFLNQLKQKIEQSMQEMNELNSPFDYSYKKNVLFPNLIKDYTLYSALGGMSLSIPKNAGEKPLFSLVFEYEGEFSNAFKSILEKTIQDDITKFGKISSASDWKIVVSVCQESQTVTLDISASHNGEIIHNTSVYDTKKSGVSNSFFAKRLGVQAYKKMQKWGKH